MTKSLRDYIKEKFIENNYMKTILKKTSPTINMFIEVGEDFGYGDKPKKKYDYYNYSFDGEEVDDFYFYPLTFNDTSKKMAYLDYSSELNSSIYMDKEGKIYSYNYTTHSGKEVGVDMIPTKSKIEKYNNYMKKLANKPKTDKKEVKEDNKLTYMFIGDDNDKKFFYGSDENFYMSDKNTSKTKINEDTADFLFCKGVWTNLEKLA